MKMNLCIDLIKELGCPLVLVSRNYLGSINHSLMTAKICQQQGLDVAGWVFNDQYMNYEAEIAGWSGYPISLFYSAAGCRSPKLTIRELSQPGGLIWVIFISRYDQS